LSSLPHGFLEGPSIFPSQILFSFPRGRRPPFLRRAAPWPLVRPVTLIFFSPLGFFPLPPLNHGWADCFFFPRPSCSSPPPSGSFDSLPSPLRQDRSRASPFSGSPVPAIFLFVRLLPSTPRALWASSLRWRRHSRSGFCHSRIPAFYSLSCIFSLLST